MFGEETGPETPIVRYCAVSAIENSHRNVITSLEWIPDHFEVGLLHCKSMLHILVNFRCISNYHYITQ